MATVCAKVFKHHKKGDGTFNVKIRVFHKNQSRYIDTEHYVSERQLSKDLSIKDPFVNRIVNKQLDEYRIMISNLEERVNFFTAETLKLALTNQKKDIDFVHFCDEHIKELKRVKRDGTAANHTTIRNSLVDYFNRRTISINEITYNFLLHYEKYLRQSRSIIRIDQFQKEVKTTKKGLLDAGIYNHMRDLRTLFNAAKTKYNDEDLGIIQIQHYPFKRYKVGSPPETEKRNITLKALLKIQTCVVKPDGRAELARDLFVLSFYLCGMNAVDLYHCNKSNIIKGRLEYNRTKTKGKRKDKAFISIKIINEAKPLLEKYLGQLNLRYCNHKALDKALSKGLEEICKTTKLPKITFYWARHTFATVARNQCRISTGDIGLALNHIDNGHKTTDIYIAKDWKIVDDVQIKVVKLYRKLGAKAIGKALS